MAPNSVPFEDTSQAFSQRLFATVRAAFTNPGQLFSGLTPGDIGAPLVYGVIIGTAASVFGTLWQIMFGGMGMIAEGGGAEELALGTGFYLFFMLLSPVLSAIGLFLSTALYHVALLILGAGSQGFSVTFRAVAYGSTPNLLNVLPICGGIIGGIWSIVLVILAGKQGHGTETWKAIVAYFLPTIVCCSLFVFLVMSLGLMGAVAQ
jgi:hypothetical protein